MRRLNKFPARRTFLARRKTVRNEYDEFDREDDLFDDEESDPLPCQGDDKQ